MDALAKQLGITIDLYAPFIIWALIFTRTIVMITLTPFIGGKGIPGRFRVVLSMVLSLFIYVFIGSAWKDQVPDDKSLIGVLFMKEIFFGFAIGLTTMMCFYAIEAGGRIVDNQRGSANAQIFVPQLGQVSIFGLFQFWLGIALFMSFSGHIPFLKAFIEGFQALPVLSLPRIAPGISPFMQFLIRLSADVLLWGMQLASPVLISIFLTDLVLGIANKMAPQIPVFELGFIIKGYVGVGMVYISILILVTQMNVFFDMMNGNVHKLIQLFAH